MISDLKDRWMREKFLKDHFSDVFNVTAMVDATERKRTLIAPENSLQHAVTLLASCQRLPIVLKSSPQSFGATGFRFFKKTTESQTDENNSTNTPKSPHQ